MPEVTSKRKSNRRLVLRLSLIAGLMFGFGFVMVPLYDVFCDLTGLNGKVSEQSVSDAKIEIDYSRQVKVRFIATHNGDMPWRFAPNQKSITINPGAMNTATFMAHNPTSMDMTAQMIPSVSPAEASLYLHKTECFCFDQQSLAAGEKADMAVVFYLDPRMPKHLESITMAYTIFDVTHGNASDMSGMKHN